MYNLARQCTAGNEASNQSAEIGLASGKLPEN